MVELTTTEAREGFADLVGRVAYGHERFIITRNGKPQAAVIPIEYLQQLEALITERGLAAFLSLQEDSVSCGLDKLSDEDIDAEIRAARSERRNPKTPHP